MVHFSVNKHIQVICGWNAVYFKHILKTLGCQLRIWSGQTCWATCWPIPKLTLTYILSPWKFEKTSLPKVLDLDVKNKVSIRADINEFQVKETETWTHRSVITISGFWCISSLTSHLWHVSSYHIYTYHLSIYIIHTFMWTLGWLLNLNPCHIILWIFWAPLTTWQVSGPSKAPKTNPRHRRFSTLAASIAATRYPPQPRIPGAKNMFSSGCPFKQMVRILVVTITGFGVDLSWMLMSVIVVRCLQKKCGKYGRSQIWKTKYKHISFPTWRCFFSSTTFNFLTWLPTSCVGTSNIYQTLPRLFEVAGKGFGKQNPCVTLIRIQRKLIAKTH